MKEYFYISDRKLESYEAQIGPGLEQSLSAEISANLGVLKAKLKTRDPLSDRVTRLQLVSDFIVGHFPIGSLSTHEPRRSWIRDYLNVRIVQIPGAPSVFFLVGQSDTSEVCALIGSMVHVLGSHVAEPCSFSASYFPAFIQAIKNAQENTSSSVFSSDLLGDPGRFITGNSETEIAAILNRFQWDAKGYEFQVSFLARSVFRGQTSGFPPTNALSPLWVAIE